MANGLCPVCAVVLAEDNCPPSVLARKQGYCFRCLKKRNGDYYSNNKVDCLVSTKIRMRTLRGRWTHLKVRLRKEATPKSDSLWNFDSYSSLVTGAVCHYCLGSLSEASHSLDRKDNSLGHVYSNVVPCCKQCNEIKGARFTYEQMMLIAPSLQKIRQEVVSTTSRIET